MTTTTTTVDATVPMDKPSGTLSRGRRVRPGTLGMMFNPRGLWRFLRDPEASRWSRVLAFFTVLYVISPVDLIPDWFVPVAGWLDDLGVVTLALTWVAAQAARYQAEHPVRVQRMVRVGEVTEEGDGAEGDDGAGGREPMGAGRVR